MIHKTFTVEGTPDIDIRIESGRVEVHRGEANQVDINVDTDLPGFIVEQRGNSVIVSSDENESWSSRRSAYVVIATPEGSDLRVSVASAPVTVDVPVGKAEIKTASGDVDVERANTLVVKSASGDLDVGVVVRALRYATASGDLRVTGSVGGTVVVSTASGDVVIEKTDATIELSSASGDAHISYFAGRSATFKAMSGAIDLGIPEGTTVDLDVSLLSGKLRVPDPDVRTGPAKRQMSIRAKLVSGDLTISRV